MNTSPIIVATGTTSVHKLTAARSAARQARLDHRLIFEPFKAESGVPEQPIGLEETAKGAERRALEALRASNGRASFGLGIENGLVSIDHGFTHIDLAVVAFAFGHGIETHYTTSSGIPFPKNHVKVALDARRYGDKPITAGASLAQAVRCDGTDPHSYLTRGRVSRADMLEQAILSGLAAMPIIESARPPRLYLASSWRNSAQPAAVEAFRAAGFDVYDFRNPEPGNNGFAWSSIESRWREWSGKELIPALNHPTAVAGFDLDMNALMTADATALLMGCGRSAHLELGYACGARQKTAVILTEQQEPELMWKMADVITTDVESAVRFLAEQCGAKPKSSTSTFRSLIQ